MHQPGHPQFEEQTYDKGQRCKASSGPRHYVNHVLPIIPVHRHNQIMRRLEKDLRLDFWFLEREGVGLGAELFVNADPAEIFDVLQLVLILIVLGLFLPELVVGKGDRVGHGLL